MVVSGYTPRSGIAGSYGNSTPVLLLGESHGHRSLVGCSPWGRSESHMTEQLHFHFSLMHRRRKCNPLQYSCLENPRDRGACWVAICGVAQSRTRLTWPSSSSMVTLFLFFKGASMPLSIQAVPIYTPSNSIEGFVFLHTLWSKPDEKR